MTSVKNFCSCVFLVFSVLFARSSCAHYNISLDKQELQTWLQTNTVQEVVFSKTVNIYCEPDGKNSYNVYNIPRADYETCAQPGMKLIGSCVHSPLDIRLVKLAISFDELVSYEIGRTYYFGVYEHKNGEILNSPCMNGFKFSFKVVSEESITESPPVLNSSTTVLPVSSTILSDIPSSTVISVSPSATLTVTTTTTTTATTTTHVPIRPRPSTTSSIVAMTTSTTTTNSKLNPTVDVIDVEKITDDGSALRSMLSLQVILLSLALTLVLKLLL